MKTVINGVVIKHKGVVCDMDCPYFQVVMGDDEDRPLQPRCGLFFVNINDSLQRADECIEADKEYQRKLEIHSIRSTFFGRIPMLQLLKRIDYAFNPTKLHTIKELCDAFEQHGVTKEEIQKICKLNDSDFNNALSSSPYPYVTAVFKQLFNFPIESELTLRDRLQMAAKRISNGD